MDVDIVTDRLTDTELDAIRERLVAACNRAAMEAVDVAALLAEVERLRAERAQMTEVQEWVGTPDAEEPWRMAYRLHRRLVGPWLPVGDGQPVRLEDIVEASR